MEQNQINRIIEHATRGEPYMKGHDVVLRILSCLPFKLWDAQR